jgi:protoheme IX farnesyltransferase
VALAPAFTGLGGGVYLGVAGSGGLVFLLLALRLARSRAGEAAGARKEGLYDVRAGAKDARNLFAFSILYLALLFATLLMEHLMGLGPLELIRL